MSNLGRADYDYHVQQQHQLWSQGGRTSGGGGGGGQDARVADRGKTTTALSGNRLSMQPKPRGSNHQSRARTKPYHGTSPLPSAPHAHNPRIRDRPFMRINLHRPFHDYETQFWFVLHLDEMFVYVNVISTCDVFFIWKLFSDCFMRGKCPSMSDVHSRTTNSELRDLRTVLGIWRKAKQLLATGRWMDYVPP
ncbi:unnamed protein product [Mesocestoides corti]|uniref:Uncharacterized protein n=1 Tax=Mesocestoides corti TaxID=53468 RepID=A0A0R3UBV0_MESCO|nr:unnamed protein product [Mesocestoides corti]